jgi:N-acetylglucosaminyldiphosphoundecaprenol N-acetyl-beta-D-mannosaminyltransferase
MKKRIQVLGTPVDNLTMQETLDIVKQSIETGGHLHHSVVNAGKIVLMHQNAQLKQSVESADLINADGAGVVLAARLLGKPLVERVTGIDLMEKLVEMAYKNNYKIYFFGAKEEVIQSLVEKYRTNYNHNIIAGFRNGYFVKAQEPMIAQEIANSKANILFVAMTSPLKENFLYENREVLKSVNFIMGVGGSFDVVSGLVKRAPVWMQKSGLEWFFRVYQEPKRMFKRYMVGNAKFIKLTVQYSLGLKR